MSLRKSHELHQRRFSRNLGVGLTLAAIHMVGINITGVSVNPARSFGPALFAGASALADLWLFIVAPLAGGVIAGVVFKMGLTRAEGHELTDA